MTGTVLGTVLGFRHLGIELAAFDFKDKMPIPEEEKPINGKERKEDTEKKP